MHACAVPQRTHPRSPPCAGPAPAAAPGLLGGPGGGAACVCHWEPVWFGSHPYKRNYLRHRARDKQRQHRAPNPRRHPDGCRGEGSLPAAAAAATKQPRLPGDSFHKPSLSVCCRSTQASPDLSGRVRRYREPTALHCRPGQPLSSHLDCTPPLLPAYLLAGNSGGPLLDSSGAMIGINTAIYSQSGAAALAVWSVQHCRLHTNHPLRSALTSVPPVLRAAGTSAGVGFAIPVDIVKSSVTQVSGFLNKSFVDAVAADALINSPAAPCLLTLACRSSNTARSCGQSWASALPLTSRVREWVGGWRRYACGCVCAAAANSLPSSLPFAVEQLGVNGVLVLNALEGGPAAKAGVRGSSRDEYGRLVLGDIILSINGTRINTASDLYRILDKARVGDEVRRCGGCSATLCGCRGRDASTVPLLLSASCSQPLWFQLLRARAWRACSWTWRCCGPAAPRN